MSQKRNLSPSLTINNWDENITCSTTQSGLSQHLLDAHRMARERSKSFVISPQTWLTERQWQHLSSANCWAAELVTPVVRGEWERRDDESMGKRFPQLYYKHFDIIYTFHRQHILQQQRGPGGRFFSRVLLFYHFPTSASCLITKYTKRLQGSNHTRS